MKKRLFILTLLSTTALSFASPISTPNSVNDTPIVSNGGGTVGGGQCQAYQSDGAVVNLSGGETLVFYGSGHYKSSSIGGYLSTKSTYSGTAYVKADAEPYCTNFNWFVCHSYTYYNRTLGLFNQNTTNQSNFIAGAGAGGIYDDASGGGWVGVGVTVDYWVDNGCGDWCDSTADEYTAFLPGGGVYSGIWFKGGFYGSDDSNFRVYGAGYYTGNSGSGASSISAFYNIPTKQYTSLGSSYTITGGGFSANNRSQYSVWWNPIRGNNPIGNPILYVCK